MLNEWIKKQNKSVTVGIYVYNKAKHIFINNNRKISTSTITTITVRVSSDGKLPKIKLKTEYFQVYMITWLAIPSPWGIWGSTQRVNRHAVAFHPLLLWLWQLIACLDPLINTLSEFIILSKQARKLYMIYKQRVLLNNTDHGME